MMAYQYATIKKYLHGIAFKEGSHVPWRQAPMSHGYATIYIAPIGTRTFGAPLFCLVPVAPMPSQKVYKIHRQIDLGGGVASPIMPR
jgi:hypothetical protein